MARILGISGKRGSGKSLLGGILGYHGFKKVSLAASLKDEAMRLFNLGNEHVNGELKEVPQDKLDGNTPRQLMIDLGALGRKFSKGGMFWVERLYNTKIATLPADALVVIDDIRFINEAEFFKKHGAKIVRLERDPKLNVYKEEIKDASETELDDYKFDLVLKKEDNINPQSLEKFAYEIKSLFPQSPVNTTRTHIR